MSNQNSGEVRAVELVLFVFLHIKKKDMSSKEQVQQNDVWFDLIIFPIYF